MRSNRNLVWLGLAGVVLGIAAYCTFGKPDEAPLPPPEAVSSGDEAPVADMPSTLDRPAVPSDAQVTDDPAAATAAEAERTVREINESQQKQMMEPTPLPSDDQSQNQMPRN